MWKKIAAVGAAVLGLGIFSIATFRFAVEKLHSKSNPTVSKIDSLSRSYIDPSIEAGPLNNSIPNKRLSSRTLTSLLSGSAYLAPCREAAFEYGINEDDNNFTTYFTWYDDQTKTVNIQPEEEFLLGSRKKLITLSQADRNRQCDNAEIIQVITTALEREVSKNKKELSKKFTQTLNIIRNFFTGEKGILYSQQNPMEMNGIKMWLSTPQNQVFLLHMERAANEPKLTLSLTNQGMIERIYLDDQIICPQNLLKEETWGTLLAEHLQTFLQDNAFEYESAFIFLNEIIFRSEIHVHPRTIAEIPEYVLMHLEYNQICRYLNHDLTVSPGLDDGGLSRQFYHDLALHLFDGSPNRKISLTNNAIPTMRDPNSIVEQDILRDVGSRLIKNALFQEDVTLGNVLKPAVYKCIKFLSSNNNTLTDETRMKAARLLSDNKELDFLFTIYDKPRIFSSEEIKTLTEILAFEKDDIPSTPLKIKEFAKNIILDDLHYRKQILAIHYIVDGILGMQGDEQDDVRIIIGSISGEKLCEWIQGVKFDPQGIADRIFTESEDPVIIQKCIWLKEHILESSEKEIKRFLLAVTGTSTVTAETKIEISGSGQIPHCTASICTKTIQVPDNHTDLGTDAGQKVSDKQKFLNNFKLIYSESGFDMG